jgi:hypothetical protein
MKTRRPATTEDVRRIAAAVLLHKDVSGLVSKVILTEKQRDLIRRANAEAAARVEHGWIKEEYAAPNARFLEGGAPGLVQQKR